uniref:Uncharacterized protein n=1 Tax=Moniliophthora roreri TaxID=221103 RepID=A0A0W0EZ57_MONRR
MKSPRLLRLFARKKRKAKRDGNTLGVHRLPPELLIYVFELCVQLQGSNEFLFYSPCRDIQSPALTLSQVCAHWRSLAHGIPMLWGRIGIKIIGPLIKHQDRAMLQTLEMHFERSCDSPIELSYESTYYPNPVTEMCSSRSHILVHRLQHLKVVVDRVKKFPGLTVDGTRTQKTVFPELRSLVLISSLEGLHQVEEVTMANLASTQEFGPEAEKVSFPKLRELSMPLYGSSTGNLHIPWRQLTSLTLGCNPKTDVTSILKECPCLIYLTIRMIYIPGVRLEETYRDTTAPPLLTLERLEYLAFQVDSNRRTYNSVTKLLQRLTCPSLLSLSLSCLHKFSDYNIGYFFDEDVTGLIVRSQCQDTLRSLEVSGIPVAEASLLAILHLTPSLTSFSFSECSFALADWEIDGTLFAGLIDEGAEKGEKLVPNLRDIRIVLEGRYDIFSACRDTPLGAFEALIRSRLLDLHSAVIDIPHGALASNWYPDVGGLREIQQRKDVQVALKVVAGDTELLGYDSGDS